ncbi:MAG: DUF3078 domain-containing protein [Bernardetiaceae bacterium]
MNPKILLTFFISLFAFVVLAQDETDTTSIWTTGGSVALNFSNVGLSNWAGGGQNSLAIGTVINLNADRETEKSVWKNNLKFQFGMARVGSSDTNLFKKTDDLLILNSNYGYKLTERWSVSLLGDFRTQVADGNIYARDPLTSKERVEQRISRFLAPGYLQTNLGFQYKNETLVLGLSPLASKFTFVMDDSLSAAGAFGVEPGKNLRAEVAGFSLNGKYKIELMENVQFETVLMMFANYQTLSRIDINWDTLLSLKVNDYISATFGTSLIYDHDVILEKSNGDTGRAIQFRHALNVGLSVSF